MHLDLTPEEFERLLKLVYLGEAVVNDWVPADRHDREQLAATDMLYDLCATAEGTPSELYVRPDEKTGEWMPSPLLDNEMDDVLGRYDNAVFWDELITRLSRRDFVAEYGQQFIDTMTDEYRKHAEVPLIEYYAREVQQHGIHRLVLKGEERQLKRRSVSRGKKRGRLRPRPNNNTDEKR